jgi:NADH-quinone oxidoreductase subunit N
MQIFSSFIPEIFLSFCILFQLVFNICQVTKFKNNFPLVEKEVFSQTFFILVSLLFLYANYKCESFFSTFILFSDLSSRSIKILFVLSCLFLSILLIRAFKLQRLNFFEYFSLFLLAILALLLLINCTDMISAYLVIEMQTLCFYILASFTRNSAFSTDAGLKYFIVGAFVSGLFLFGCSLVYGGLGTLNFNALTLLLAFPLDNDYSSLNSFVLLGVLFITVTFLFKLGTVPFHFWVPDVYEGAPLATTILFTILPKFAIFYFLIKLLLIISTSFPIILNLLYISGLLSIFIGALFAIRQKKLKRLLIFSSISQVGFLVAVLSVLNLETISSLYFFLIIYLLTTLLIWSQVLNLYIFQNKVVSFFSIKSLRPLFLSSLANFYKYNKLWSFTFILIFFSLAGIPPLSGFLAKFFVLFSFISMSNTNEALLLVLISTISVFYYLRVIKIIFFESKDIKFVNNFHQIIFSSLLFEVECLLISIGLFLLLFWFFYPTGLLLLCQSTTFAFFNF